MVEVRINGVIAAVYGIVHYDGTVPFNFTHGTMT